MQGNFNPGAASVHPFHHSPAVNPRPELRQANVQPAQAAEGEQEPGPPAQTPQEVLAAELADFLWRRQEPGLDQLPSSTRGGSGAQDSGTWRDQLLAEIEDLAKMLKDKVSQYSLIREARISEQAAELTNESAVVWIEDALEDIAATALGIEIASRKLMLGAAVAGEPNSRRGTAREKDGPAA